MQNKMKENNGSCTRNATASTSLIKVNQ